MTNPLFGDDTVETPTEIDPKTAMETLVGEGKKYKTTEDAIKALWHSQQHIARLEHERAQQQAALNERKNGEDLLALIEQKLKATSNEPPPVVSERVPSNNGNQPVNTITQEDIERLLEQKLAERTQVSTAEQNLNKVLDTLKNNWGPAFQADLRAKANEMGVSQDYLLDLAKKSPAVFLSAVGGNARKGTVTDTLPPTSSFASTVPGQHQPQTRNYAHYQKLLATNRAEYWSPKVQNQMLKDLAALGDKFYS